LALKVFKELKEKGVSNLMYASCEPLLEKINIPEKYINYIDWIIIGGRSANSKGKAEQPEWTWVADIFCKAYSNNIIPYFKTNLTFHPEEYPESLK